MEEKSSQDKAQTLNKVQQYIYFFRWFFYGLLIALLFYIGVILGSSIACQNGTLIGLQCVQPKMVDMVAVCEYNSITCAETCHDYIINDMDVFRATYQNTACKVLGPVE